ncbi:carbohydrate porin, partial [Pseudomonas sp. CCI3.1]
TTQFAENGYKRNLLENEKKSANVPPLPALRFEKAYIAQAMETNIVSNAFGVSDAAGDIKDQSQTTGYCAAFNRYSL